MLQSGYTRGRQFASDIAFRDHISHRVLSARWFPVALGDHPYFISSDPRFFELLVVDG